jgi:hypothetical protein
VELDVLPTREPQTFYIQILGEGRKEGKKNMRLPVPFTDFILQIGDFISNMSVTSSYFLQNRILSGHLNFPQKSNPGSPSFARLALRERERERACHHAHNFKPMSTPVLLTKVSVLQLWSRFLDG